jgi:hypothetical protein
MLEDQSGRSRGLEEGKERHGGRGLEEGKSFVEIADGCTNARLFLPFYTSTLTRGAHKREARPHMTTHLVTPGDPLFPATTHAVGPGTHVLGGSVCASLVGRPSVVQGADGQVRERNGDV